jgi:PBP1b-binding outer membrane lipoprotein LpoB
MLPTFPRFASVFLLSATVLGFGAGCPGPTTTVGGPSIVSKDLDPQDFSAAAESVTNQMLAAPRVQDALKRISAKLPQDQRPMIKISRIRNDTGLHINLVDYFVTPIESVLINSGKADSVSEDKQARDAAGGRDILNGTQPRTSDLILYGVVSKLYTSGNGVEQNAYTFQLRLSDANTGTDFFIGLPKQVTKQTK